MTKEILFEAEHVKKWFPVKKTFLGGSKAYVKAVDDVSLKIYKGETLGIVGESGCGKSTLIRTLLRLVEPTEGKLVFEGKNITKISQNKLKAYRRNMQIVFQDPYAALNPRQIVGDMLAEPLLIHHLDVSKEKVKDEVIKLLIMVGLPEDSISKYPHEFSGGQRQRLCIARALAVKPKLLVCDECVSALDVSIQAQIINLLMSLQREMGLTLVFVSHDLRVIRHIANRVAVMYLGKIVDYGDNESVFTEPKHPYTQALLSAIPVADPDVVKKIIVLKGDLPSPIDVPSGCGFRTRCWRVQEQCAHLECELKLCGIDHWCACPFAK
jgi:oligopeptide/dipeptide ABC transporter ATP-binding protein